MDVTSFEVGTTETEPTYHVRTYIEHDLLGVGALFERYAPDFVTAGWVADRSLRY